MPSKKTKYKAKASAKSRVGKKKPQSIRQRCTACMKRHWGVLSVAVVLMSLGLAAAIYRFEQHQYPQSFAEYPVQGIDVSRHQGHIDWAKIDPKRYQFVFIKATEGGDYRDPNFRNNWQQARAQGLMVGGYHFFRNCKSGQAQAENFIAVVPKTAHSLAPVIDLEFQWQCPEVTAEQLQREIAIMAQQLHKHYGKTPILYTTPNYYQSYIHGELANYPLWLQDFKHRAKAHDARPWLFWQYSQTGKVSGIHGAVDLNIFRGDLAAWQQFLGQQPSTVLAKP